MATFTWTGQNVSGSVVLGATNRLAFSNSGSAGFAGAVPVGEYAKYMYRASNDGTVSGSSILDYAMYGLRYAAATTCTVSSPPGAWSSSPVLLTAIPSGQCFKVSFGHTSAVSVQNATFWAYDGLSTASRPAEVTAYAFPSGSSTWTLLDPTAPIALADQATSSATHDYYLGVSVAPAVAGPITAFAFALNLEYY
jgi:hypothetical protein